MAEYRAKTAPILPIYEARGLVHRVDGMADIEQVGGDRGDPRQDAAERRRAPLWQRAEMGISHARILAVPH